MPSESVDVDHGTATIAGRCDDAGSAALATLSVAMAIESMKTAQRSMVIVAPGAV
jgi:hypothetical protein